MLGRYLTFELCPYLRCNRTYCLRTFSHSFPIQSTSHPGRCPLCSSLLNSSQIIHNFLLRITQELHYTVAVKHTDLCVFECVYERERGGGREESVCAYLIMLRRCVWVMCVHMLGGQKPKLVFCFQSCFISFFLKQDLSLSLEFVSFARLTGLQALRVLLSISLVLRLLAGTIIPSFHIGSRVLILVLMPDERQFAISVISL